MKIAKAFLLIFIISVLTSCETIYNYDLSYTISTGNSATRNALNDYIPFSIDLQKGTIGNEMLLVFRQLDANETQIADSLRKDLHPMHDSIVEFSLTVTALDPENGTTIHNYSHTYSIAGY
jgi:hypothetical protein